jgi:hypothetical protein
LSIQSIQSKSFKYVLYILNISYRIEAVVPEIASEINQLKTDLCSKVSRIEDGMREQASSLQKLSSIADGFLTGQFVFGISK